MAGDLRLLVYRKQVFLKVSLCYFQKSLEGCLICIPNQTGTCWHQNVHFSAIVAMCAHRPL